MILRRRRRSTYLAAGWCNFAQSTPFGPRIHSRRQRGGLGSAVASRQHPVSFLALRDVWAIPSPHSSSAEAPAMRPHAPLGPSRDGRRPQVVLLPSSRAPRGSAVASDAEEGPHCTATSGELPATTLIPPTAGAGAGTRRGSAGVPGYGPGGCPTWGQAGGSGGWCVGSRAGGSYSLPRA